MEKKTILSAPVRLKVKEENERSEKGPFILNKLRQEFYNAEAKAKAEEAIRCFGKLNIKDPNPENLSIWESNIKERHRRRSTGSPTEADEPTTIRVADPVDTAADVRVGKRIRFDFGNRYYDRALWASFDPINRFQFCSDLDLGDGIADDARLAFEGSKYSLESVKVLSTTPDMMKEFKSHNVF